MKGKWRNVKVIWRDCERKVKGKYRESEGKMMVSDGTLRKREKKVKKTKSENHEKIIKIKGI